MHHARPDGEGDQAAVFSRVPCSGNQKNAEDRINTADHLQIVGAFTAMPDPARRPHEAERIDQPEDNAENNKREFQIALSGLVVYGSLPSVLLGFLAYLSLPLLTTSLKKCAASISTSTLCFRPLTRQALFGISKVLMTLCEHSL